MTMPISFRGLVSLQQRRFCICVSTATFRGLVRYCTRIPFGEQYFPIIYEQGAIEIEGYEMLKGLSGVATHEHKETVPIVDNSQDHIALSHVIENVLRENPNCHSIYLRRHGLYTWGESVADARRHVEIFEFLFEVLGRSR